MEVTATKVVVLLLLGTIKLVFGLAPLILARVFKKRGNGYWVKKFIGAVLCIGGGVLLSTVFIHMLKEVRESMDRARYMGMLPQDADYPFAELIICMGFLLILLVESIVHKFCGGHGPPVSDCKQEDYLDSPEEITVRIPRVTGSQHVFDNPAYLEESPCKEGAEAVKPSSGASPYFANKKMEATGSVLNMPTNSYNSATDSLAIRHCKTPSKVKQARDTRKLLSSVRGFLVVVALSVHSLFEGMAVGLEETSGGVWQLFMAIAIHSIAIVFCIGMEMVSSGTRQARIILSMVVLSVVTPLGVVMGLLLTLHAQTETGAHVLLVGVLQGVAAGTLLYITFFEVLARDKLAKYGMSGLVGALVITLGFTIMAALNGMGGHSHGGGEHAELAGHGHAHHEGHQLPETFGGNIKFRSLVDGHDRHLDDVTAGAIHPYDHFHEEYDLDHGDHVHHIGPHDSHDHEDGEDFPFDMEDYSEEKQSDQDHHHHHPNIYPTNSHQEENRKNVKPSDLLTLSVQLKDHQEHHQELEQGHQHHLEDDDDHGHHDEHEHVFDYSTLSK